MNVPLLLQLLSHRDQLDLSQTGIQIAAIFSRLVFRLQPYFLDWYLNCSPALPQPIVPQQINSQMGYFKLVALKIKGRFLGIEFSDLETNILCSSVRDFQALSYKDHNIWHSWKQWTKGPSSPQGMASGVWCQVLKFIGKKQHTSQYFKFRKYNCEQLTKSLCTSFPS